MRSPASEGGHFPPGRPAGWQRALHYWPLLAVLGWLPGIADLALFDPDEGRNASIARSMAESGDWLIPQLNGIPFLDKPFLFFAAEAGAMRLFGASELSARLPSLLAGGALVALLAWWARRQWGETPAILAAGATATSLLVLVFSRAATFDALLTLCTTVALLAFHEAIESPPGQPGEAPSVFWRGRSGWLLLAWGAMAAGTLTKGPVALLLPLGVASLYGAWRRRFRTIWSLSGVVAGLGLLCGWLALVEQRMPGFLRYALVEESWRRVTTDQFQRTGPIWYFLPILLAGAFPWVIAPWVRPGWLFRRRREAPGAEIFLAIWLLMPLLLLSLSQSKRPQYMLPLVPAIALLAARSLSDPGSRRRAVRIAGTVLCAVGIALLAARSSLAAQLGRKQGIATTDLHRFALLFGIVLLLAGIGGLWAAGRRLGGIVAISLPVLALPVLSRSVALAVSDDRSSRPLAEVLEPYVAERFAIVGLDTFVPSLPFYLGTNVVLCADDFGEMTSNSMLHFERRIVTADRDALLPADCWRRRIAQEVPLHSIFLLKSGRASEIAALGERGLVRLYESRKLVAFGPAEEDVRHD
ncbi:MAG: ArnT family glycosyltransferase [Thermoanaerobaculia bacterium]